jgi:hypothetical protein
MTSIHFGAGPIEYIKALRMLHEKNPEGVAYYDFILNNAVEKKKQPFTEKEKEELSHIFSSRFPAKECYSNAQQLAICNDELDYVEGWVDSGLPIQIEHAWNEYRGKIIDVTLVQRNEKELKKILPSEFRRHAKTLEDQDRETKRLENATYYGVKLPRNYLIKTIFKKQIHTSFLGEFFYHCIHPAQKGLKPPKECGDLKEFKK